MKSCFSTLGCTDRTLPEILALAVKYRISSLEFRGIASVLGVTEIPEFSDREIDGTASMISSAGLKTAVIGTSCAFHDAVGDKLANVINEGTTAVGIAHRLHAPFIRVFGNRIRGPESISRAIDGIRTISRAADSDVSVLLEVHGDFNTAEALSPVCDALAGEKFGLIWDICHTDSVYGDAFEPFYRRFSDVIRHIHVKDVKRGGALCLPGDGDIPIVPILSLLSSEGFDGCVSLEWEKKWHPELPEIEEGLDAYFKVCGSFLKP
ncbi:MAG: sugar phosphate isomerase/epimerase [Clostridia bacterium]|nr:sugar phosphate isomerase/epimerase [Clostridia bacterium]